MWGGGSVTRDLKKIRLVILEVFSIFSDFLFSCVVCDQLTTVVPLSEGWPDHRRSYIKSPQYKGCIYRGVPLLIHMGYCLIILAKL